MGDVHGDYERLIRLLSTNHIVAADPNQTDQIQWAAGRSLLVCTGDMIDRWTNGLAVVRFFRELQKKARQAGGEIIVTMGNHEAEFLSISGDHQRTQDFENELRRSQIDPNLVRKGEDALGEQD